MESMDLTIKGSIMLMHNGQLADPANPHSKAVSMAVKVARQKKTDVAHEAVARAEFEGGLYLDDKGQPCIPGEMLEAVIVEGAKTIKQGNPAKAGIIVEGNYPLQYKGPRDVDGLWEAGFYKKTSAKIGRMRVMRTRPMFIDWSLSFRIHYNPSTVSKASVRDFVERAGAEKGLGDWRPRYGRFEIVK